MIRVPSNLLQAHKKVSLSAVVTRGKNDEKSLAEFERAINSAMSFADGSKGLGEYLMFRTLYKASRDLVKAIISSTPSLKALYLWTDYATILDEFNLRNKIWLRWTGSFTKYRASKYRPRTPSEYKVHVIHTKPEQTAGGSHPLIEKGRKQDAAKKKKKYTPKAENKWVKAVGSSTKKIKESKKSKTFKKSKDPEPKESKESIESESALSEKNKTSLDTNTPPSGKTNWADM